MLGPPHRLRCEYLNDPLGIDTAAPRLSWWPNDPRPAEVQTAYRVLAASRRDLLDLDEGDLWDSGRVESQQTSQIVYRGKRLGSGRKIWWKVRSFDSDGLPSAWSEPARFEVGLLDAADWRARWIATPLMGSRATSAPVPCLRRVFDLDSAPREARLYVAALGLARVEINGRAVGSDELAPGWMDYERCVTYHTYDVTAHLSAGANCLGVLLADGWFAGRTGLGERQHYGKRPEVCAQLHLLLESGRSLILTSDALWQWRPSWIMASDLVSGESIDWRQHDPRWSQPDSPRDWYPVELTGRTIDFAGRRGEPLTAADTVSAECLVDEAERRVYALREPVLGRALVTCRAAEGTLLRVRYGLAIDGGGHLAQVLGEDVHVAAGGELEQSLTTCFTMHGFRYLEVSGDLFAAEDFSLSVQPLGLAEPAPAEFLSDHAGLNELYGRLAAGLRATLPGFPAAGLGPGERVPLLRQAGLRFRSALLTQPAPGLLGAWLSDVAESQLPEGGWPAVVPAPPDLDPLLADGGAGVSDVPVEAAWLLFRLLGDRRALETLYPRVRRFLGGLQARHPGHLRGEAPGVLEDTVWYHRSARSAARVAGVLGYLAELEDCEALAAAIRQAFRQRFVTPDGLLVGDDFSTYLAALNHGVLDTAERKTAVAELLRRLESLETAGSLGDALQPDALRTLTLLGRSDLALQMLLDAGGRVDATDGALLDSGCLDWLLASLAGMDLGRDLSEPHNAFRRMRIQPRPPLGGVVDPSTNAAPGPPLRVVEAALDTVSGRYEVRWEITEVAFELTVVVPCNCAADVILPDETVHEVVAGRHTFSMPFHKAGDGIPILREVSEAG